MKGELKPGALALVVGCVRNPVNIGKCVELVQFLQPGDSYTDHNGKIAMFYPGFDAAAWLVFGDVAGITSFGELYYGHSLIKPEHLMPLGDDPDEVKSSEREKEHV